MLLHLFLASQDAFGSRFTWFHSLMCILPS